MSKCVNPGVGQGVEVCVLLPSIFIKFSLDLCSPVRFFFKKDLVFVSFLGHGIRSDDSYFPPCPTLYHYRPYVSSSLSRLK